MTTTFKLSVAVLFLFFALNGCRVDKVDPPELTPETPAVITTSTEAAQAFSSVLQARDFYITTASLYKDLGEVAIDIMVSDPTLSTSANTDIACADGGFYKYSGTTTGTTWDLSVTFTGCRQNRFQYEGTCSITGGTPTDIIVKLNAAGTFNIFYFNPDYTVLIDYLKEEVTFSIAGSGTATDASYAIKASGKVTNFDYFLLDTYKFNFSQMTMNYVLSTDPVSHNETTSLVISGIFSETTLVKGLSMTTTAFSIERVKQYSAGGFSGDDTTVSGKISFGYRPDGYCFEGTYLVETITPVHTDYALNHATAGTLTINGVATAEYNAGGDVEVSVAGSSPLNYANELVLMKICNYSAMEQNIPPLLGQTGTASGNTMAVTLTWYGPSGSASDMDLHLKFYSSPTPTTGTSETWHVDWAQGKTYPGSTDSCSDPYGIKFLSAFDLDDSHGGTCDVGLDIDDRNGYGPEHITALKLLPGYYVASVNSYSLHDDLSATMYLAIHIGDSIFGPYTTTLSAEDTEGTDPAAWFRVADIRVNDDGTVDILPPDMTLEPWGSPPHTH